MKRRFQTKKAFSLVEVTIAIGIAAFGIISMLGLLGSLMSSGRESSEDTVLSDIAKTVAAGLRARPFDPPASGTDNSLEKLSKSTTGELTYFSMEGATLTTNNNPLYTCTVTVTAEPEFSTATTGVINLYEAKIEFSWPYPKDIFKKTFRINLARYDK